VVGATNWTYTNMGYVATRTDPLSTATVPRVATWTYDLAGRNTERRDAAGRRFTFGFDVAGNQTSVVDANANTAGNAGLGTTTMTFDQLNRLTNKSYSDGTPPVSWTFDGQGRVETMVDGAGTTTYAYDAADRVNLITRGTDTWTYTYDSAGNITSRTVPGGANSTATFDDAGQLTGLADTAGSTSFGYDQVGNNTTLGFPNGVTQTRTYDRASRLNTIATAGPGGPIGGFTYTRDPNGNPTAVDVSGPTGVIVAESMRNTYDNADRLTKTCFTTTTCATANQTVWTYNAIGSRLTEKIGSAAVSTYTYDTTDQLTAITGPGAATFTYNPNGDQLTAGTDTFTYNTARQTVSATVAGVTTQYAYDGNGNRHTVTTAGVAAQEVWDTIGGLPTLVAQRNAAGVVQRRYTYAGATPIKYEDVAGGASGYYQTDGIGTVTNLTTPTGTIGATYRYNPYGTTRAASTVLPAYAANPLKYTGQQQDPTGNYNLRARHYNPGRGAFTQTDPMPLGAGSAFEGLYVYGRNNPGVYVDPSGKRGVLPAVQPVDGVPEVLALAAPAPRKDKCGTYDRKKAVEYARKYALSPNDAEYHVYTGNGGEDCTNFISQSLKAGGWTTTSVWNSKSRRGPGGPIGVVRHFPDSAAWSIANVFYNTWRNSDRAQEQKTFDGLELGDIIAADWGPNPDGRVSHNMIITGFRGKDPLLSYHSTNVLDRSFAEIQQENPGTTYHYLKLRNSWCSKG
jgi:RHS repeat-associated protein